MDPARSGIVVITGASGGIGRAAALAWARRGAKLVLSARGESALAEVAREVAALGGEAVVEAGDVTDETHRVRLIEKAERSFGGIDVLVNNAGARVPRGRARRRPARGLEGPLLRVERGGAASRLAQLALPKRSSGRSRRETGSGERS